MHLPPARARRERRGRRRRRSHIPRTLGNTGTQPGKHGITYAHSFEVLDLVHQPIRGECPLF
jgi:hypothetical protein